MRKEILYLLEEIVKNENISKNQLKKEISKGRAVLTYNIKRPKVNGFKLCAIGRNLKTKVNANIGTSPDLIDIDLELKKLQAAIDAGTDTVMDLSIGGNIRKIRNLIIKYSKVPVGTVPIYQAICELRRKGKDIRHLEPERLFSVIEEHCADGVDFITVHCGVTRKSIETLKRIRRVCGIVSRGGVFHAKWILSNEKENPLYEKFDKLLEIAKKYNVTLSLGDGLRPGSILDACDEAQIFELKINSELAKLAHKEGVGVIIEGPGHMPLDKIKQHIKLEKKLSDGKPFYLLGPLVTDIAAGFDHISSAIGAAVAASYGADFICCVTPSEHIRLPDVEDVYLGVIAAKISAHAADVVKLGLNKLDYEMSKARKSLDWTKQMKLSIDPQKFLREREKLPSKTKKTCSMCGSYCAMREASLIKL